MNEDKNPYADIIQLPHHQAINRPHMSMLNRAAQFSPYAALVGFDGIIAETGRLTAHKIELDESQKDTIDRKLSLINNMIIQNEYHPTITVTYFVQDPIKNGGVYEEYTGKVLRIDDIERVIVFLAGNNQSKGKSITIENLTQLYGDQIDNMYSDYNS